jgi:hypothetical protein
MKRPFLSAVVSIILVSATIFLPKIGFSQRASQWNNNIAIDFVDFPINNVFHGQYEGKLSSETSFNVRAEYVTKSTIDKENPTTALGFGGGFRFYMLDSRALSGFSVAPSVDVYFFKNSGTDRHSVLFAVGADAAYKFFFGQFTVEPTVGARDGFAGSNLPAGEEHFTGIYPVISIYLGWAW